MTRKTNTLYSLANYYLLYTSKSVLWLQVQKLYYASNKLRR